MEQQMSEGLTSYGDSQLGAVGEVHLGLPTRRMFLLEVHLTVRTVKRPVIPDPALQRPRCLKEYVTEAELLPHADVTEIRSLPHDCVTQIMILSLKVCAGRIRTNVPTPGYNIQPLFRILPQHTVALRCAKSLELPQNGFLRGNQIMEAWIWCKGCRSSGEMSG